MGGDRMLCEAFGEVSAQTPAHTPAMNNEDAAVLSVPPAVQSPKRVKYTAIARARQRHLMPRRILVIDDNTYVTRSLMRLLRQHSVCVAHDVRSARRQLAAQQFDLILCDVMMPEVTGVDLYRRLCREAPHLTGRFYFMTGGAFSADTRAFIAAHAARCLEKPFEAEIILDLVAATPIAEVG